LELLSWIVCARPPILDFHARKRLYQRRIAVLPPPEGLHVNSYNFTERVRKVLELARDEVKRRGHEYVGTEHMLLGLIKEGEGVAVAALTNLQVDPEKAWELIGVAVRPGKATHQAGEQVLYTTRAKKVLELAMTEASELGHGYVGTEHLFLGMLREEKGVAAQVLHEVGVTLEAARAEIKRLLGIA
jgi:ATP-dependent Clp protease ATP-binding subunit ClpC